MQVLKRGLAMPEVVKMKGKASMEMNNARAMLAYWLLNTRKLPEAITIAEGFARDDPPFPGSLPEFQQLFPDDLACAAYLEAIRWPQGFVCGWCGEAGEPYRFKARPHVLACRKCKKDSRVMAGTIMQDSHTRLSVWFWAAYIVATHTQGMSAVQFQRQLVDRGYAGAALHR